LKKRNLFMAKKSMLIAAIFGLISSIMVIFTGDGSAYQVAQKQPMKLAAMEGLYQGKSQAGLVAIGILNPKKDIANDEKPYYFKIEIPYLLSFLSNRDVNSFVPGIEDLIYGNEEQNIMSAEEKMARGRVAIQTLQEYQNAKKTNDTVNLAEISKKFNPNTKEGEHFLNNYFKYFGYGYLNDSVELIPNVALTFYSFHIMVALGFIFVLLFIFILVYVWRDTIEKNKFLLYIGLWSILFGFLASQMGWIVAEVGRQPWIIQDLMPTIAAVTHLSVSTVQTTFVLFAIIFTTLLIAELRIMFNQIRKGPDNLKK
ncbi:MAG TPA: cytochrome ubiquinol oxidase subunit I, partial [Bacteroidales bacterium]|nr:cytochrome ubiquinol oxidase subunit I [Bacteroidales bacterium]